MLKIPDRNSTLLFCVTTQAMSCCELLCCVVLCYNHHCESPAACEEHKSYRQTSQAYRLACTRLNWLNVHCTVSGTGFASKCRSNLECYPERAVVMQNPFDYLYRDHDVEGMSDG